MENEKKNIQFSAIHKEYQSLVPALTEKSNGDGKYVDYGEGNVYPQYLYSLYQDVSTLKGVVEGIADYVCGNGVELNGRETVNRRGDTPEDLVKWLARDWLIYGGFALQIIRGLNGQIVEVNYVDYKHIRSDEKNNLFWYSKEWDKKWGRKGKAIVLPKFNPEASDPSSILYVKNSISTTYPVPLYSGAIKACEIEKHIDQLHLAGLENGFTAPFVISFNDGIPDDEQKAEIEKEIYEKFCGSSNGGRVLISFSSGKDNALTVTKLDTEDYGEKYQSAADRSQSLIYAAFRATPNIFGLPNKTTGFNSQEYLDAFKLFNRTVVRPIQQKITRELSRVSLNITIVPFSLEGDTEKLVTE